MSYADPFASNLYLAVGLLVGMFIRFLQRRYTRLATPEWVQVVAAAGAVLVAVGAMYTESPAAYTLYAAQVPLIALALARTRTPVQTAEKTNAPPR